MIDQLILKFVMKWCKKQLTKLRKENRRITIFWINDPESDDYLMFTDKYHVKREMESI